MDRQEPPRGFEDRAPKDRYCDLVLTGGVTSAIAYPPVAFGLGEAYRFNAIGGASSGAGIAAVVAAAEYRRRHGSVEGFNVLVRRSLALADEVDGRANLRRLFQPLPAQQRLFNAVLRTVASPRRSKWGLVHDLLWAYRWPVLTGLALGLALVWAVCRLWGVQGALAWLLAPTAVAATWLLFTLVEDVQTLANDDYGLCDGISRQAGERHPPLTTWLHGLIQETAGRRPDEPPLTFADLHAAPGCPRETLGDHGADGAKSIRLQVMVANITLGEPVQFPRRDSDTPLYFRPAEMRRLFPASVVAHLLANSKVYEGRSAVTEPLRRLAPGGAQPVADDMQLRRLPLDQLPIVVAARMSISFPVLFTAVALWREDPDTRRMRRCLMFDGGFCSNFPIHLFDSFVPAWPTFGVSLFELPPTARDETDCCRYNKQPLTKQVRLPMRHQDGMAPRWNGFDEAATAGQRILGLLGAMLNTTKDWSDATLARMPGVRDRVVRVGLAPGIGGLNLLMRGAQIRCLAEQGKEAVRQLLDRFARPGAATGQAQGWDEHRWVRFNLLCGSLARGLAGLTQAAQMGRHATPLPQLIQRAKDRYPLEAGPEEPAPVAAPLRPDQAAALQGALAALAQAESALGAARVGQPYQPHPEPELHVRPPL